MQTSRIALLASLGITALALGGREGRAADVTWDNGSTDFLWNLTSLNWTGAPWVNSPINGAIFGATGAGTLNVASAVTVDSLSFTGGNYTFNGGGSINYGAGTSTQTTGVVNVASGVTAQLNVPITSSVGFQKIGAGILELSGASNFAGPGVALTSNGLLRTDVLVGGASGPIASGTLRLMNSGVLPASTRVSIANGYLDIGSNNTTLSQLIFVNQSASASTPWNTALNANNGVIGSGTLRVTGDINVIGVGTNAFGNSIAAPFDLGGGTQVIRVGVLSQFALNQALMFTNTVSNGSILKVPGYTVTGNVGSVDGISLFGNNTYTGSTVLNSGTNVITGTNATTSVKIAGLAPPGGSQLILQGASGSVLSATTLQAVAGGTLVLDNNAAIGASGNNAPNIPAAQNNDRIRDDAAIELRDGNLTYRGLLNAAATETFGSLNASGGHGVVNVITGVGAAGSGTGTATLTATGNLTMASRATLVIGNATLGAASKFFVSGTIPTADATGILPRIVGTNDFLTYSGATGFTPLTTYAPDFTTPGANVSRTTASTIAGSATINALKTAGTFTTTIGAADTLTVTSGMLFSQTGTHTFTGGTVAFGATPGALFGSHTFNSALTGTQGLIVANGTATFSATSNLAGLSGPITVSGVGATAALATNTFTGPIDVRAGTLNLNTSQTGAGLGAITLGVSQNDANLLGTVPTLSFGGAGANATFDRPIVVDNGALNLAGAALPFSMMARLSPLSNATGSQTWNGNITLNSPVNLQGGGGGGTGATNFTGTISGPAAFFIPNGRVNFTPTSTVSNAGGFTLGNTGNTMVVNFQGTATGNAPLTINGGNNNVVSYSSAAALPGGTITVQNASGTNAPSLVPTSSSTINNTIQLNGDAIGNVGAGLAATWAGPIHGTGALSKNVGTGSLTLTSSSSTHTGAINVNAGTLLVNGTVAASTSAVTVGTAGTLGGSGTINRPVTVNGTLAPGNSPGVLTVNGNVGFSATGTLAAELNGNVVGTGYDQLAVNGTVGLGSASLSLSLGFAPASTDLFFLVANDGTDAITGTFNGLAEGASVSASFGGTVYSGTISYLGDSGTSAISGGNDVVLHSIGVAPEPGALPLLALGALGLLATLRLQRREKAKSRAIK